MMGLVERLVYIYTSESLRAVLHQPLYLDLLDCIIIIIAWRPFEILFKLYTKRQADYKNHIDNWTFKIDLVHP